MRMHGSSSTDRIKKAIDYVEENIKERLTLDDISASVNLSKFHLNRVFRAITEKQLMEYVRNRKLSRSIHELLNTELNVIDISFEYGFQYEQSYSRSFKNRFGLSPDRFRKEKPALKITEKLNLDFITPIGEDGMIMEPVILLKPQFSLVGIRHKINDAEDERFHIANSAGNDFYFNQKSRVKNAVSPNIYIGFIQLITGDTSHTYYTPSLEVTGLGKAPDGMVQITVPTRKYAVFKYIGMHHPRYTNIENLNGIYKYAFGEWLGKSGYELADYYHFERIDNRFEKDDYCEVELYIPVKEKE